NGCYHALGSRAISHSAYRDRFALRHHHLSEYNRRSETLPTPVLIHLAHSHHEYASEKECGCALLKHCDTSGEKCRALQPGGLFKATHQVHVLQGLTAHAFHEIIQR